ncbi:acyltransferase family protein [Paenibacillus sp. UMB4589-SE434]|uniref:acyltransferase family protein n=1 Tax=Paenibacillus sp. UMB4589-SE434 TaxID=3046314 RepID=UPI00254BA43C|nr:acyltransferase family protein [Paenibacillus sp. UMB4589-SE434]MDK8181827.1 acyltransferase family protein [Paenibacillus sp. UMB4589-SE434]
MPEPRQGSSRYMPALDGLRALAVIAVIAYHLNLDWAQGGFLGVGVFFVLSGYLVTDLLLAGKQQRGSLDLHTFWIRRFRRLLPALVVMLVLCVAWLTVFEPSRLAPLRGDIWSTFVYGNNWWLIFHHVSYFESFGPPSPFLHLWSLAVEGQFYLVWPILLVVGLKFAPKRGQMVTWITIAASASAIAMAWLYEPGADPSRVYYGTDTRVFALLIGAALAIIWPSRRLKGNISFKARWMLDIAGAVGLATILYMMWSISEYDDFLYRGGFVLLSAASALLIAALAHPASRLSKLLGWKPLKWIGLRSYGIYLWHYPVIMLTSPVVNTNGFDAVRAIVQVSASVLLAALSWRYIERPIQNGIITTLWQQFRVSKWSWRLLSWKQWMASVCCVLLLALFFVGMSDLSQVKAAIAEQDKKESADHAATVQPKRQVPDAASGKHAQEAQVERKGKSANTSAQLDKTSTLGHKSDPAGSNKTNSPTAEGTYRNKPVSEHLIRSVPNGTIDEKQRWSVSAIGDSVMLDVAADLTKLLPGTLVNAKIGRQMSAADDVLSSLKHEGKLGDCVIIALGTNGVFSKKQLDTLIASLEGVDQIILVNIRVPRKWESQVNDNLANSAATHPNITLVDWYSASANKDAYFEPDATHLRPKGAKAYASLLAQAVKSVSKPEADYYSLQENVVSAEDNKAPKAKLSTQMESASTEAALEKTTGSEE